MSGPGQHGAQGFERPMGCHLQRRNAHPGRRRRLLQRHFPLLEQFDRLSLARWQRRDGLFKRCPVHRGLIFIIRRLDRKGYVERIAREFSPVCPRASPHTIHEAPPQDRHQPRHDRASRIIGMANLVKGQQRVLHHVLDVGGAARWPPLPCEAAQDQRDLAQQLRVARLIAKLGRSHQRREM